MRDKPELPFENLFPAVRTRGGGFALGNGEILSPREADALRCVWLGHSNYQIAPALSISLARVRALLSNLMLKTGLRRQQLSVVHDRLATDVA